MTTYSGGEAHPEVWRIVAEHRGRKELRNVPGGTQKHDPRLTPKGKVDKFPDN